MRDAVFDDEQRRAFEASAAASGAATIERAYRLAGRIVRLRVVGPALAARFAQSWTHLEVASAPGAAGALHIDICAAPLDRPAIAGHDSAVTLSACGGFVEERSAYLDASYDRRRRRITARVRDDVPLPIGATHKPFQMLISAWLSDLGVSFVHAGMVSRDGHGALVAGPGGVGKTTTVLSCVSAGLDILGDDRVGVEPEAAGGLVGWSLYGSVQFAPGDIERYPWLRGAEATERLPTGKAVAFLGAACGDRLVARTRLSAVLLPRLARREVNGLSRARPREALVQMVASTLACRLHAGQAEVDRLGAIAEQVPCYWLDVGAGVNDVPQLVADALDRAWDGA